MEFQPVRSKTGVWFEPNQGQWDSRYSYAMSGQGFRAFFDNSIVTFATHGSKLPRLRWVGAADQVQITPQDRLPGISNYYVGKDSAKWAQGVAHFSRLRVDGVYPGVDVIYYGSGPDLEYDLDIAPGADITAIALEFEGARDLKIRDGALVVKLDSGELIQQAPVAYQTRNGRRVRVPVSYRIDSSQRVHLDLEGYDAGSQLLIDPVISWGNALGGNYYTNAYGVGVDSLGNVYVAGYTGASDFPLVSPYDGTNTQYAYDAFLSKYSSDGTTLLVSTYFGGSSNDAANALAIDSADNVYIAGYTYSSDFATKSAYQSTLSSGQDGFVAKFTSSGALTYSTYLGGSGADLVSAIAVDGSGNAYVTGTTLSSNFPTSNAYQTSRNGSNSDAFLTKLAPGGNSLVFSTYFGGGGSENGQAIRLGPAQRIYIGGTTASSNLPTLNAYQAVTGNTGGSGFVTAFNADGQSLYFSTYLGGSTYAVVNGLDVDSAGAVYATGVTGTGFPTLGAIQSAFAGGQSDAFLTKIAANGSSLIYSTYLGGQGSDGGVAVAVDASGNAFVTGASNSADYPTFAAFRPQGSYDEGFITQVNASGNAISFSSFLGGYYTDYPTALALGAGGAVFIAGYTNSGDFPSGGNLYRSYQVAFVVKLTGAITSVPVTVTSSPTGLSMMVDGVTFTSPKTFNWAPGVMHNLTATSPQSSSGPSSNTFLSWSNGGPATQTITTPASTTTYTATYQTQLCTYSLSPTSATYGQAAGGSFYVAVTTQPACPWTGTSNAGWITGYMQGTGSGSLSYSVAANAGTTSRTGTITVGSATHTVTQQNMAPSPSYSYYCCGSNSGLSQTFQFTFSDPDGVSDLTVSNVLINNFLDGRQACYLAFDHVGQVLYLVNDAGTAISGMPFASGYGSGVLSNSQCAIDGTKTSISSYPGSTSATLTVALTFQASFGGNKVIYLASRDKEGMNSGWKPLGVWGVPKTLSYPAVMSGSVSLSYQLRAATVSATFRDSSWNTNLSPSQILINSALDGSGACYIGYDHVNNKLYLVNDSGTALLPPITPGTNSGFQQNSQCIIYAQGTSANSNGADYTLQVSVYFLPAFTGPKIMYAATQTVGGGNSGWQAISSVNLP